MHSLGTHSRVVIAGLDPAIHRASYEVVGDIVPIGITGLDESDLPCAGPFLEAFFPLDSVTDVTENFRIHERLDAVSSCETGHEALPMFVSSTRYVARNANVERAILLAGHDVDEVLAHRSSRTQVDRRVKPGDDNFSIVEIKVEMIEAVIWSNRVIDSEGMSPARDIGES